MANIMRVSRTVLIAMMRVLLLPLPVFVFEINIVAEGLLLAPSEIRSFLSEVDTFPVFV